MAAKAKLSAAKLDRILEVMAARKALPSDKQLARELGVSVSALYRAAERLAELALDREAQKLHNLAVSRGTK